LNQHEIQLTLEDLLAFRGFWAAAPKQSGTVRGKVAFSAHSQFVAMTRSNQLAKMHCMESVTPENNRRLCELVESAGLSEAVAITLFNRGRSRPVTHSEFRAWMAQPESPRWRALPDDELVHAERMLGLAKID